MKTTYITDVSTFVMGAAVFSALTVVQAHGTPYTVIDLGPGVANGINNSGQVAGYALFPDGYDHAVRWTSATPTDLGTAGGNSFAYGINGFGEVAGYSVFPGGTDHALKWSGTAPTDLGANSRAFSINSSGEVAGYLHSIADGSDSAVTWTGITPTTLGTLGGAGGHAYGINDSGVAAGDAQTTGSGVLTRNVFHAVSWTGTSPNDFSGSQGSIENYDIDHGTGFGINAVGQIVGWAYIYRPQGPIMLARIWASSGEINVGSLFGIDSFGNNFGYSYGYGINSAGHVTGMSGGYVVNGLGLATTIPQGSPDAFLYDSGGIHDLNNLLAPGSGVTNLQISQNGNSINDFDQIAATGTINGQQHALLLTPAVPTPEPTSSILLLSVAGLLGLRRRRDAID